MMPFDEKKISQLTPLNASLPRVILTEVLDKAKKLGDNVKRESQEDMLNPHIMMICSNKLQNYSFDGSSMIEIARSHGDRLFGPLNTIKDIKKVLIDHVQLTGTIYVQGSYVWIEPSKEKIPPFETITALEDELWDIMEKGQENLAALFGAIGDFAEVQKREDRQYVNRQIVGLYARVYGHQQLEEQLDLSDADRDYIDSMFESTIANKKLAESKFSSTI